MKKILIAIPCYNCQKQIIRVLNRFNDTLLAKVSEVLVVDNKSCDNTVNVTLDTIEKLNQDKFSLIVNKKNYGLGGSFKIITSYACNNHFDYLILLHGDDQANPAEIIEFLKHMEKEKDTAAIFGSRFMKDSKLSGYSRQREYANRVLNYLFSFLTFTRIYDLGSGLNLYNLKFVDYKKFKTFPDHIAFDIPLLLYYIENKMRIKFMPISWDERDQVSNAKNIEVALQMLWQLIKWRIRYPLPKRPSTLKMSYSKIL